jgi:hypothetical protein
VRLGHNDAVSRSAGFSHAEAFLWSVGVRAKCFAEEEARDAALTPQQAYWSERKREWVRAPEVGRQRKLLPYTTISVIKLDSHALPRKGNAS